MAYQSGVPVYRYQFTKENGYHGNYHAGELIYAYGNVKKTSRKYCYDETDLSLADTMVSYWTNFAKTGNPNGEGLPTWDLYNPTDNKVMEFGEHVGSIDDRYLKLYEILEEFINWKIINENS